MRTELASNSMIDYLNASEYCADFRSLVPCSQTEAKITLWKSVANF